MTLEWLNNDSRDPHRCLLGNFDLLIEKEKEKGHNKRCSRKRLFKQFEFHYRATTEWVTCHYMRLSTLIQSIYIL